MYIKYIYFISKVFYQFKVSSSNVFMVIRKTQMQHKSVLVLVPVWVQGKIKLIQTSSVNLDP